MNEIKNTLETVKAKLRKLDEIMYGQATVDDCVREIDSLIEDGLTDSADSVQPEPSFFVIVDAERHAEFVTDMRHEAQEHINDACEQGVEGAGKWKAIPVFEMRPTDDRLWEQTLRDRDTYHEWADKLAEAIAKHFGADIGEHSNMNCPWAEALEVIESADSVQEREAYLIMGWGESDVPDFAIAETREAAFEEFAKMMYDDAAAMPNEERTFWLNSFDDEDEWTLNGTRWEAKFEIGGIEITKFYAGSSLAAKVEQEPIIWESGEEWEPLAFALCEEEHDDPHQLIYDGYPPEPWGEVWQKYEGDAKRMIQMVRKYTATHPQQEQTREPWMPYLSDRADGCKGRYAIARWNPNGYREVWNMHSHRWAAFSDEVLTLEQAHALMQNVTIPTAPQAQQESGNDAQDAARIDWLEEHKAATDYLFNSSEYAVSLNWQRASRGKTLRAAIDAAMQASPQAEAQYSHKPECGLLKPATLNGYAVVRNCDCGYLEQAEAQQSKERSE